jgi:hypothetical protein
VISLCQHHRPLSTLRTAPCASASYHKSRASTTLREAGLAACRPPTHAARRARLSMAGVAELRADTRAATRRCGAWCGAPQHTSHRTKQGSKRHNTPAQRGAPCPCTKAAHHKRRLGSGDRKGEVSLRTSAGGGEEGGKGTLVPAQAHTHIQTLHRSGSREGGGEGKGDAKPTANLQGNEGRLAQGLHRPQLAHHAALHKGARKPATAILARGELDLNNDIRADIRTGTEAWSRAHTHASANGHAHTHTRAWGRVACPHTRQCKWVTRQEHPAQWLTGATTNRVGWELPREVSVGGSYVAHNTVPLTAVVRKRRGQGCTQTTHAGICATQPTQAHTGGKAAHTA